MTTLEAAGTTPAAPDVRGPQRSQSTFRQDIQGLRALAVLSVALDHAHIRGFSGGFVGVDVFFVISGFLITQLLLNEAQRTGAISLMQFYSRRAKRILPAGTVVLVATVLASVFLLNFVDATAVIKDSIWATFFAANIKFGNDGTDYFAADNAPSPLQHFWSLAVEEQFYLVWPLLLLLLIVAVLAWRRRTGAPTTVDGTDDGGLDGAGGGATSGDHHVLPTGLILAVLILLGGASLVWSISLTDRDPTAAYFSTPARAWELAIGAICAVIIPALGNARGFLKAAVAWLGLAAVLYAIFRYDALTPFPGKAALLPVVGTAMMIVGGSGTVRTGPKVLLSRKPFLLIGDWSYSLYLWHWPILIIAASYAGHQLPAYQNLLLLAVGIALSALTYEYVENPFRRARQFSRKPRRGLMLYPGAIGLTLIACLMAHQIVQHEVAEAADAPPITINNFGGNEGTAPHLSKDPAKALVEASVKAAENNLAVPGELKPSLLSLNADIADVGECEYLHTVRELCPRGDVDGDKVMVVFGDSHARSWIAALDSIAKQEGYVAYYLVKPGCNAAQTTPDFGGGPFEDCLDWRQWAIDQINDLKPEVLIVANDVPPAILDDDGNMITDQDDLTAAFKVGLAATLTDLRASVRQIIVMGDVPGLEEGPGPCLAARDATLGDCAFPRSERSIGIFNAAKEVASEEGLRFVNPLPWFCADKLCPSVVGSTVTYRDMEHITTVYAAELSGPLEAALHLKNQT